MRNLKARLNKLEKEIKPNKNLYKIYWADGTFLGKYHDLNITKRKLKGT